MKGSIYSSAVLVAASLMMAAARTDAADAVPDPAAEIKAMTNVTARGNAWVKRITEVGEKSFAQAETTLDAAKADLTATQLAGVYAKLAVFAAQKTDDPSKVKAYIAAIASLEDPTAQNDALKQKFEGVRQNSLAAAISGLTSADPALAEAVLKENRSLLKPDQIASLELDFLLVTVTERNRAAFDVKLSDLLAQPMSGQKINGLAKVAGAIKDLDNTLAEKLLRDALASKEITAQQRTQLLGALANVASGKGDEADSYGNWKTVYLEILALADKGEIPLPSGGLPFAKAFEYGDVAFADALVKRALAQSPKDYNVLLSASQGALIRNDLQTAAGYLKTALENERLPKDSRDFVETLVFLAEGKPITGFDEAFAAKKLTSADKLRLFYKVSEFLFRCDRYEMCRAINGEVMGNMFSPLEKKHFTVRYDKYAPKTAEGWTHTPSYTNWAGMETRFVVHGDMFDFGIDNDIERHLKDAVQPEIPAGYRTGVFFLCNDEGFHIYVRADDPHADEIVSLKRTGGGFNMNFKAGAGNAPYNIWFPSLPDATGGYIVDWASPTKTYALARDIFKRDAVVTREGIAAHVLVPWQFFCTQLPFDGNDWQFGMVRNVPGVVRLALTGNHQEFGRLVQLTFDLTPGERSALKRQVAALTFNTYNRTRRDPNEFILTWKDSMLGDPNFFTTTIEPLLKDLDEAGARLTATNAPSDTEVDALFAKYVPLWGNIKYVVADKRTAYLREKLMK